METLLSQNMLAASEKTRSGIIDLTSRIVACYIVGNAIPYGELGVVIHQIYAGLRKIEQRGRLAVRQGPKPVPAVPVKKSVTPDFIICLEDGKTFKSLKRYLAARYGMTPNDYRAKWGLPSDYPMVAPNYAKARAEIARQIRANRAHNPRPKDAAQRVSSKGRRDDPAV